MLSKDATIGNIIGLINHTGEYDNSENIDRLLSNLFNNTTFNVSSDEKAKLYNCLIARTKQLSNDFHVQNFQKLCRVFDRHGNDMSLDLIHTAQIASNIKLVISNGCSNISTRILEDLSSHLTKSLKKQYAQELPEANFDPIYRVINAIADPNRGNFKFLSDQHSFSFEDWKLFLSHPDIKSKDAQKVFKPVFDIFVRIATSDLNKYVGLLFKNPCVLSNDHLVDKLRDEHFLDAFFNKHVLHTNGELRRNIIELLKRRPELLNRKVSFFNSAKVKVDEKVYFRLYNLGYKKELTDIINDASTSIVNKLHDNGYPLILLACKKNDKDLVRALATHPDFNANIVLNKLDQKAPDVTNILFHLAHLMPQSEKWNEYADHFRTLTQYSNIDLKTYNNPNKSGTQNSILLVIANNAAEHLSLQGEMDKKYNMYCSLFNIVFEKVKEDEKFLSQLSVNGQKHNNILHAIAKIKNPLITDNLFNHYQDKTEIILKHLSTPNDTNHLPLEYAYICDNKRFIDLAFADRGANSFILESQSDRQIFNLLISASIGGNKNEIAKLFDKVPRSRLRKVLLKTDSQGMNIVHHAANETVLKYIIDQLNHNNANHLINQADNQGSTPLLCHVSSNNRKNVEALIDNGADINKVDCHGNSPLIVACSHVYKSIVEILSPIPYLDIDHKNNDGVTALDIAVATSVMDRLAPKEIPFTDADKLSREKSQVAIVGMLVDCGADTINYKEENDNLSYLNLLPALKAIAITSLRHTANTVGSLFATGTRDFHLYQIFDTANKLDFVFRAHDNMRDVIGKVVRGFLGQALNYKVDILADVTFGKTVVKNNLFYTTVSQYDPKNDNRHNESNNVFTYIPNTIGNALRSILQSVGIISDTQQDQFGITSITKTISNNEYNESNIDRFIQTYPSVKAPDDTLRTATVILNSLLKSYLKIHQLKQSTYFSSFRVVGAQKMQKDIADLYNKTLEKTNVKRVENDIWRQEDNIKKITKILQSDSIRRSFIIQHLAKQNCTEYQTLNLLIRRVRNGHIFLEMDQYIALTELHSDVEKAKANLNHNNSIIKFAYICKNILMDAWFEKTPTYRFSDGSSINMINTLNLDSVSDNLKSNLIDNKANISFARRNIKIIEPRIARIGKELTDADTTTNLKKSSIEKATQCISFLATAGSLLTISSRLGSTIQTVALFVATADLMVNMSSLIAPAIASSPLIVFTAGLYGMFKLRKSIFNISEGISQAAEEEYEYDLRQKPISYALKNNIVGTGNYERNYESSNSSIIRFTETVADAVGNFFSQNKRTTTSSISTSRAR